MLWAAAVTALSSHVPDLCCSPLICVPALARCREKLPRFSDFLVLVLLLALEGTSPDLNDAGLNGLQGCPVTGGGRL